MNLVAYWCNQCILLPILDDILIDQYILLLRLSDDILIGQYILLRLSKDKVVDQYIYWFNTFCLVQVCGLVSRLKTF